jgi:uncharacterized protein YjbI with pentapeptide repeats
MPADDRFEVSARLAGQRKVRESEQLYLQDLDLVDDDFSGRKLRGFTAVASRFTRCRFERMKIDHASFGAGTVTSSYVECSFDGSRIRAPSPGYARFERCSFRDVRLKEWICWTTEFVDCVFSGRAEKVIFGATVFDDDRAVLRRSTNEFRGNDFRDMELRDVDFRAGIDLSRQLLPDSDEYVLLSNAREAIVRARAEVSAWDDDRRREDALRLLRLFSQDVDDGQEDLFLRPATYARHHDAEVLRELFGMLGGA